MTTRVRHALARRLRMLARACMLLVLIVPGVGLLALTLVGFPLVVVGVGIPLVLGAVWLTRALTDVYRRIFADAVGVEVTRPYLPWPGRVSWTIRSPADAASVWRQFRAVVREPATWRDLAWLFVNSTVGFVVYVLTCLLLWWWPVPHPLRRYARLSGLLLRPTDSAALAVRVAQLTQSRAEAVDAQAAELRRIERDLHDGAQARLVALGMSLGMAEEQVRTDPDTAARLLAEAREDTGHALAELRRLVRGMHPPVLADRGLAGAVEALALTHPLPVTVVAELSGRPQAPVESAVYFAVAETLTNVTKHARAASVRVGLTYVSGRLRARVEDDGNGGAAVTAGGGLYGVERRLAAFDGTMNISSPAGGPTVVSLEIPCELSSAKTTPSSETG